MGSLQLARLLSCKPCPTLPKLGPSLGFRPLRQVGFGSLWRNQTEYGCLMARSAANMGGGGSGRRVGGGSSNQERGRPVMSTGNGEIGEAKAEVSASNQENVGDNQLKEIRVELRKNNEEIKKLRETVQSSWKLLRIAVQEKKFGVNNNEASKIQNTVQEYKNFVDAGNETVPEQTPRTPTKGDEAGNENGRFFSSISSQSSEREC